MRWSFRIGRIAGIPIQCHVTFVLLVIWIALSRGLLNGRPGPALAAVALLLLVFACVVLHELGHALAARRYGIRTRDITLLPIGGLARLERMPEKPSQELVVAVRFGALGVFSHNLLLLFIALFVFLAAGEERTVVEARAAMEGLPVRAAMLTEFHGLDVLDPLRVAVRHLMAGSQSDFPVLE